MKAFSIFIIGFLISGQSAYSSPTTKNVNQNETQYWMKLSAQDKFARTEIADLGITIDAVVQDTVYGTGRASELALAKKSGRLLQSFALTNLMFDFPANDSDFHNYTELTTELQTLAIQNPSLVRLSSIGKSVEGRDLHLITISVDANDTSRPAVFFMGGHHAREHVSIETPLKLAQYLVNEYKSGNPRIVNLINNRTVYIAPLINPDGAEFDVSTGSYKYWRKNRTNNGMTYGVDLNRNYGYGWGGGGASKNSGSDTFRGPSAFSEPETQAVKNFFETHKNISIDLSFHTFSALILYPWGHTYDTISNQQDLQIHKTMAETMAKWNGYTPQQSSELYIASGDTTDWAYGQLGVISFTFELDPADDSGSAGGFYPGQSFIEPVFQKNIEPALYLIEYCDNPNRVITAPWQNYGFNSAIIK
jgi:carboxypeptidase T